MPEVKLTRHPPERRRGGGATLCCGCTCCCCCCLHTLGAVAGAVMAPNFNFYDQDSDPAHGRMLGISGVRLFWIVSAVIAAVALALMGKFSHTNLFLGLILLALGFPFAMLA